MKPTSLDASGIATLSAAKGRFAMPKAVVDAWGLGAGDKTFVAELRGRGHVRLHRPAAGKALMETELAWAKDNAQDEDDLEWRTRAIRDKFRDVTFTASDRNRVALPQELVLALISEAPKQKVYVESGSTSIDVMTQDVRMDRLRMLEED